MLQARKQVGWRRIVFRAYSTLTGTGLPTGEGAKAEAEATREARINLFNMVSCETIGKIVCGGLANGSALATVVEGVEKEQRRTS